MVTYICALCRLPGAKRYIWTHDQGQQNILLCDECAELARNDQDTISLKRAPKISLEELIR